MICSAMLFVLTARCLSALSILLFSPVSGISTNVTTSETSIRHQNVSFIHRQSEGALKHFLILETWIDPQSLQAWTLAVAKNAD